MSRRGARGRWLEAVVASMLLAVVGTGTAGAATGVADPLDLELRAWAEEHGPLRIGWFEGAPPVSQWEDGELQGGYAAEAWDLAADKIGVPVEHVLHPDIPSVVAALRSGDIDVAGAHGARPDLLEFAEPTEPTAWERITFVTSAGRLEELAGGVAGSASTISGSPLEAALLEGFPELEYVETDSILAGLEAVERGDVDRYLGPLATLGALIRAHDLDVLPIGEAVDVIPISSWVVPGTPVAEVATAARASLTDAELAALHVRWTGFDLADPAATGGPDWLRPALLVVFALFGVVLVAYGLLWSARRGPGPVDDR